MKTFTAACVLFVLGFAAVSAQPCRVYKSFSAAANAGLIQDTIVIPESFTVGTAKITNVVLGHPTVSDLQYMLLHRATPEAEFTTTNLKAAVDSVGAYLPESPVSASSAGQWILRVQDNKPGAEGRLISLASWTLQLCSAESAPVTAADGAKDNAPVEVKIEVSKGGEKPDGGDDKHDGEKRFYKVGDSAKGMLGLLFPGLKEEDMAPDGVLGHIHAVADHTRENAVEHVSDALKLVADTSELYKGFVAKKISDTISDINKAGTATIGLFKRDGEKFSLHDKTLRGFIANLKAFVAAEVHATIEAVLKTAGDLANVHGALTGHFKSSAGSVAELVAAGLSNLGSLYLTVEGAAKTHMNGFITAKATVLESLLDKIIAALEHVEDSKLTGHVVDTGIKINVAKLEALAKALDMVEEAAKKLPTPSQFVTGKFGIFTAIIKQTHVYDLLTSVGDADRPILDGLIGKVGAARELLKKATPIVAASSGN